MASDSGQTEVERVSGGSVSDTHYAELVPPRLGACGVALWHRTAPPNGSALPRSPYRTSALPPPTARANHRDDALFKWQLWALWFDWALCGLRFVTAFRNHEQSLDLLLSFFLSVVLTTTMVLVARQWVRTRRARVT